MQTIIDFFKQYPALTVSIIVVTIFLFVLVVTLFINRKNGHLHARMIKRAINPTRIYIVDFGRDRSLFFNKREVSRRSEGNVEAFFHQFESNAVEGIRIWLEALINGEDVQLFYEADVNVESLKSTFFSLLQVLKVDKEKKIVYLESYLLRYLSPHNQINRNLVDKHRSYFRNYERVSPLYNKAHSKKRGILMVIRFFKIHKRQEGDIDLEKLLITKLKDYLTLFIDPTRVMFDLDDLNVGVFDSRAQDYKKTRTIANSIQHHLSAFMNINGIDGYSFAIGVAEAKSFDSFEDIINVARESAFLAESKNVFIFYHDDLQPEMGLSSDYVRAELDNFIKEKKMQLQFRSIVNVEKGAIIGYFSYIEPYQSSFNNYQELTEYAIKSDRDKELFSVVTRKTTSLFYNEVQDHKLKLFMSAQLHNRDSIIRSLTRMNHINEIDLVLMFDSEDIEASLTKIDEVKTVLEDIKNAGFSISLTLQDSELTLPNIIYSLFDFYIVDDRLLKKSYKNERNRVYLLAALGKLLRYKKPIILSDLLNWSDIEYFVRAGVDFISSEEITKKSSMLLPVEKKRMQKITNLTRKR